MPTYEEVLRLAERLTLDEQLQLLEALSSKLHVAVEVEESDETIPIEELAESEVAWQAYQAGHDTGISSEELKLKLLG
ncbi:MAG TPA: hypothetical protein V6C78_19120 [Crinalium sp.]|jgi:hypothetical protein